MKTLPSLLLILCCAALVACNKGEQINGHSTRTAYRSVKMLKERIRDPAMRIEFEVSFWTIRDANKNNEEFLDTVDGKNPNEIIALGREIYQQRKDSGFQGYEQYSSWEDMISKFEQERTSQTSKQGTGKESTSARDKANDVLYNLQ